MSAEMWAIIGFGVVETTIIVVLSTILIVRVSNLRKDMRNMREEMARRWMNDRIDRLEKSVRELKGDLRRVETRLEARISRVEYGARDRFRQDKIQEIV